MELFLQAEEVDELQDLLRSAVADLSHEIADTDNWEYRKSLRRRRELLEAVRGRLVPPRPRVAGAGNESGSADLG